MSAPGNYSYKMDSDSILVRLDDTPQVVRLDSIAALVPTHDGRTEVVLRGVGEKNRSLFTETLADDLWQRIAGLLGRG
jgi:hypothetical protein